MIGQSVVLLFAKRFGAHIVLGLFLAIFVSTGWIGLDFGRHWDEPFAIEKVIRPLENGIFLPSSYNYPGMCFDIGTVALLPETIPFLVRTARELPPSYALRYDKLVSPEKVAPLVAFARSKEFLLRVRAIFLCLTALSGVWIFLAVRACKRSNWEAAFAAGVLLSSWEIAYHARWIAPDAVLMQFVALWLMFFSLARYSSSHPLLWLRFAAAAAGLACGTKYQGAILMAPVLFCTYLAVRASSLDSPGRGLAREVLRNLAIFTAVFLITTPGVILEPLVFWQSLRAVGGVYGSGHGGHTVHALGEHGHLLLVYLTCALMSHWLVAALIFSAIACFGAVMLWRESSSTALLFLCVPVAYFMYVICYRVMIVRNDLLFAPFLAFFAARGAFHIWKKLAEIIWARRFAVTCFVALFALNALFLCLAAQTIRARSRANFGADVVAYLSKHRELYFASPKVTEAIAGQNATLSNTTRDPATAQRYMLFSDEIPTEQWAKWSCNRLGQYHLVSGPLDVNFDYYPSWEGWPRVIELSMERARAMQLLER